MVALVCLARILPQFFREKSSPGRSLPHVLCDLPMALKTPQRLHRVLSISRDLIFLAFVFLLVLREVDPQIIFHGGGLMMNLPVFYKGRAFAEELLRQPGGTLNYLAAALFQTFQVSWLGALAVTLQVGALQFLTRRCLVRVSGRESSLLGFLPGILLIGVYARQTFSVAAMNTALCVVAGLGWAWLLTQTRKGPLPLRCGVVFLGFGILFLTFPGASLLFLLMALLLQWPSDGRWPLLATLLISAAALPPALGIWLHDLTPTESYASLTPVGLSVRIFRSAPLALLYGVYFAAPVLTLLTLLWPHGKPAEPDPTRESHLPVPTRRLPVILKCGAEGVILILATQILCATSIQPQTRAALQVDYHDYHRQWKEVLQAAKGYPSSLHVQCAVNRALFHLGRLGDELNLRQNPEALLLYDHQFRPDWNVIDVYLDLGFVGMAHHYLAEAMDIYGERPSLLRRHAVVNTALGNVGTAQIYLRALSKVPFQGTWAQEFLQQLEADPTLRSDKEVTRLRSLMMREDRVVPLPIDQLMLGLLEINPRNRMAFEYLMSYYLMTKNLKGFATQLRRLDQFTLGELPHLYQEAMVLAATDLGLPIEARGARVSADIVEKHRSFSAQYQRLKGTARGSQELQGEFGATYFYYYYLD